MTEMRVTKSGDSGARYSMSELAAALERMSNGEPPVRPHELLLGVVATPQLRMLVERAADGGVTRHMVWATPALGVVGTLHDDGTVALEPQEPFLLPFVVSQLIDLGRRPSSAAPDDPGEVTSTALERAAHAYDAGDVDGARTALVAGGLSTRWADRLLDVLRDRGPIWRVTSCWADERDVLHDGELTVLDGGMAGYVRTTRRNGPPAKIECTAMSSTDAWRRLVRLFPLSAIDAG